MLLQIPQIVGAFEPIDIIPLFIPIIALMIPIVAILTGHQRKMAEIVHQGQGSAQSNEILALRNEVQDLKNVVYQQTMAVENLMALQAKNQASGSIEERLGNTVG